MNTKTFDEFCDLLATVQGISQKSFREQNQVQLELMSECYNNEPVAGLSSPITSIPGVLRICDLIEAKELVGTCDSWLYDRRTSQVICDLERGAHETFMASLWSIYAGQGNSMTVNLDTMAERYLDEGLGFFLSSQVTKPAKSQKVKLSFQEQLIFGKSFLDI